MFLVFGVLQGAGVSANKLYQIATTRKLGRKRYRALCGRPAYAALSRGLTFAYFAFTLLWFWTAWPQLVAFAAPLGVAGAAAAFICVAVVAALALWLLEGAGTWFAGLRAGGAPLSSSPYAVTAWCTALFVLVPVGDGRAAMRPRRTSCTARFDAATTRSARIARGDRGRGGRHGRDRARRERGGRDLPPAPRPAG